MEDVRCELDGGDGGLEGPFAELKGVCWFACPEAEKGFTVEVVVDDEKGFALPTICC